MLGLPVPRHTFNFLPLLTAMSIQHFRLKTPQMNNMWREQRRALESGSSLQTPDDGHRIRQFQDSFGFRLTFGFPGFPVDLATRPSSFVFSSRSDLGGGESRFLRSSSGEQKQMKQNGFLARPPGTKKTPPGNGHFLTVGGVLDFKHNRILVCICLKSVKGLCDTCVGHAGLGLNHTRPQRHQTATTPPHH